MFNARLQLWLSRQSFVYWLVEPLVPILHPSPWRLGLFGFALAVGNPLFGWIWTELIPQRYESFLLRGLMTALGFVLMLPWLTRNIASPVTRFVVAVIAWIELPLFFSWMYFCNGSGVAWLASVSAMILIYHHLTDWRIASAGVALGGLVAWVLFQSFAPNDFYLNSSEKLLDAIVISFSWGCALLLGLSSANLRREHLANTLTTVGIMAHELRTPLSTAALIGDAIQLEAQRQPATARASAAQLEKLASRLHGLVRNMNHQIDTEIANAKLLEFSQVLDNLIKNALHSLMAADSRYATGALRIEVGLLRDRGRIVVSDDGMGIDATVLRQIFKPFYSNKRGTGHGLGLAFCQRVVRSAGGSIAVKSDFAVGASFTIELPVATQPLSTTFCSVNP